MGDTAIEDLPIRFTAIATEIGTGHEVWLTRGSLVLALRASYALPGIFAPVHLGGRWLVDGALVNPVPVSAARALGARVVIAVNMDADKFGRGATIASHGADPGDSQAFAPTNHTVNGFARLRGLFGAERALKRHMLADDARPSFSTVMIESFNIMQDRLTRMRLAGDPPDVHITPRIANIGFLDFHRAAESIAIGRSATEKAIEFDPGIDRRVELGQPSLRRRILRAGCVARDLLRGAIQLAARAYIGIAGRGRGTGRRRAGHQARGLARCGLRIARHHAIGNGRSLRQPDFSGRIGDLDRSYRRSAERPNAEQRHQPAHDCLPERPSRGNIIAPGAGLGNAVCIPRVRFYDWRPNPFTRSGCNRASPPNRAPSRGAGA